MNTLAEAGWGITILKTTENGSMSATPTWKTGDKDKHSLTNNLPEERQHQKKTKRTNN